MVVLESGSSSAMSTSNQYLSPDYLSPLPSSLDAKNSPLALLAQTCSQIGADSSNPKSVLSANNSDKMKKSNNALVNGVTTTNAINFSGSNNSKTYSEQQQPQQQQRKSPENKAVVFKPYETNVLTKKSTTMSTVDSLIRPTSRSVDSGFEDRKSSSRTSSRKSASSSPRNSGSNCSAEKPASPPVQDDSKSYNNKTDYKDNIKTFPTLSPSSNASYGCCPTSNTNAIAASSFDVTTNPAFRNPFGHHFPPPPHHHPALLEACFPPSALSSGSFFNYARVKNATGNETIVPVCKDPYCLNCRYTVGVHHGAIGPCPPGCVQCDQKYAAAATAAALMSHPFSYQYTRPFMCNWISGDSYCGKRFRNSDELLQHLRTHTTTTTTNNNNNNNTNANTANMNATSEALALMNQLRYSQTINPSTVNALNHLHATAAVTAARYHPYSKPGLPISLTASPFSAFNPTLNPYYPYSSLYDQRIGAAVNP